LTKRWDYLPMSAVGRCRYRERKKKKNILRSRLLWTTFCSRRFQARLSPGVNENGKENEWKVLTSRAARPKAKFLLPVVSVWLTSDTLSTQRRVCRSVISVYLRWQVWKGTQLSRSARQELSVLSRRHTGCFHVSVEADREIIFQREVRWNLTPWVKKTTKRPHSNSLLLQKRRNRATVT